MNQADLKTELEASLDRLGIQFRDIRAMVLAFAAQESFVGGGGVSRLASEHHNPFGMKWNAASDRRRYSSVDFAGNSFDQADGLATVSYRVYPDFDRAVAIFLKNIFASGNTDRRGAMDEFVARCAGSWCQNNPEHVEQVMRRFRQYRASEELVT